MYPSTLPVPAATTSPTKPLVNPSVKLSPETTCIEPEASPALEADATTPPIAAAVSAAIPAACSPVDTLVPTAAPADSKLGDVATCCTAHDFTPATIASPHDPPSDFVFIPTTRGIKACIPGTSTQNAIAAA